jgi:hypothetical protein
VATETQQQTQFPTQVGIAPSPQEISQSSIVEGALNRVLRLVARKIGLETPGQVVAQLNAGQPEPRRAFRHELAREAAVYLGTLDKHVKAVYMAEYDASPEDMAFAEEQSLTPVHLILWVTRKTAALTAAATALDRALLESYRAWVGPNAPGYLVDVQLVDDHEVTNRKGYGAVLTSIHMPPLRIWSAR